MKWIFFSTTVSLRLHLFPTNDGKKNKLTEWGNGRARNEANAKVRKAEEFPGIPPRAHFARNCATFLQNKVGKVIRRPSKTFYPFFPNKPFAHTTNSRWGGKKTGALWKESILDKGSFFHPHRYSGCNIVSSPWRKPPFLRTFSCPCVPLMPTLSLWLRNTIMAR